MNSLGLLLDKELFVIMSDIDKYLRPENYPNFIWNDDRWLSVVFEDDWGDGTEPRHLAKETLNKLVSLVSIKGEKLVTYEDPNFLEYKLNVPLLDLDDLQLQSSAFYVMGSLGWGICGTGDGWCAVGGTSEIMTPFISSCGGFSKIKKVYPLSPSTLNEHKKFIRLNFKSA